MTQNQIAYKNARENERHNQAVENENFRHNYVNEKLQNAANALQRWQIAVNNLHYTRMDAESERTNKANEAIRQQSNAISAASLAETSRHQKTIESLQSVLNQSTQAMNYAHAEEFYADAGLKNAQTTTEGYRPGQIVNEIDLTNSQANLNREKLSTEKTSQIVNISSAIRNVTGAAGDVFQAIGSLITPSSSGGSSTFWEQMSRQLKKAK